MKLENIMGVTYCACRWKSRVGVGGDLPHAPARDMDAS